MKNSYRVPSELKDRVKATRGMLKRNNAAYKIPTKKKFNMLYLVLVTVCIILIYLIK